MSSFDHYNLMEEFHYKKYDSERDYILEKYNKEELTSKEAREIFNKYRLSKICREIPWKYSQYIINNNDNVLFQMNLRFYGYKESGGYGQNWFHMYVIENENKLFAKIINIMPLDDIANECCRNFFGKNHVDYVETINVGIQLKSYKEKVNELTQIIELDSEFDKLMKKIGQIDFKESYLELFDYQFDAVLCSMDIYDFVNKKVFYADSYCLKKYKPFIDVIEYIFRKAKFKSFEEMPMIHIVDNLDFAHKMAAKKFIDREYHHYFDIL